MCVVVFVLLVVLVLVVVIVVATLFSSPPPPRCPDSHAPVAVGLPRSERLSALLPSARPRDRRIPSPPAPSPPAAIGKEKLPFF